MAAIALMGSVMMGCSESDLVEQTPKGGAVTLTTTISLDGSSATTRALDADGKKTFNCNNCNTATHFREIVWMFGE